MSRDDSESSRSHPYSQDINSAKMYIGPHVSDRVGGRRGGPVGTCDILNRRKYTPIKEYRMALAPQYPATRHEPAPLVDLSARAERERLSPSKIKVFFNIMAKW